MNGIYSLLLCLIFQCSVLERTKISKDYNGFYYYYDYLFALFRKVVANCVQVCLRAEELLKIYQINGSGLNRDQFTRLSPALIQQLLSKACTETKPPTVVPDSLSVTERKYRPL